MFFVVTTGRSGSQTIARVLSQSPDCICLHEPEPVLVQEATLYEYGLLADPWLKAILLSTRPRMIHDKVYGESNQKLASLIPLLAQIFPEAQFIWLVRDGRDVVASTYYARGWYQPTAELDLDRGLASKHRLREWIWYRLRADLVGEMSTTEWEAVSRFDKNCWFWTHTNTMIQRHLAALPPKRWLRVRLETLSAQMPDIARLVGIRVPAPIEPEYHNVSTHPPTGWEEWPEDQRAAFEKWCGDMMNVLYPGWQAPGSHQRRAIPIPLPDGPQRWWQRIRVRGRAKR